MTNAHKRGKEVAHRFPLYCKSGVPFFEDDPKKDKRFFMAFCSVSGDGTTAEVKIFLWPSFVTKKRECMEMLEI